MQLIGKDDRAVEISAAARATCPKLAEATGGVMRIPEFGCNVLDRVAEFLEHAAARPEERSAYGPGDPTDNFCAWDRGFSNRIKADDWVMFGVIAVAKRLDARQLLEVGLRTAAIVIRETPPEQLFARFKLVEPSAAEIVEINRTNPWLNDL